MKLARVVFLAAGIWGIAALMPLFWPRDLTGRVYVAPVDYPHFFYGFADGHGLADCLSRDWHEPLAIPAAHDPLHDRKARLRLDPRSAVISEVDAQAAVPDLLLGLLFVVAFVKTRGIDPS
jgi:hypothetical protein